ncbi:VOC family protein [Hymenobacter sp. M29]|uniref:VOC family protein n=1 Tax=Hymenobacter mellowenesis TaxID=3063995 RepID=A0ABT9A7A8_9BACT|nr:VOC family protein [Hymenobacter sp. M29]MDO7845403.1 VOC family protein [Hymenobacter sp. M29]
MQSATQLGFVSLQVSDLEASRHFYTEVLGFRPAAQTPPDACVFETQSGATFAIRKPMVDLQATTNLGWGVGLWFAVAGLDDLLQRIAGKATLVQGVQSTPFGNTAIIADPDGYWLTLQETKQS